MESLPGHQIRQQRIRFILIYISFTVVGLVFALWLGLGWLLLFQTIRILFFAVPRLYIPTVRFIIGPGFADKERVRLSSNGIRWFKSPFSAFATFIMIALTIFFFWKVNIPLIDILRIVVK